MKNETGADRFRPTAQDIELQADTFRNVAGQSTNLKIDFRYLAGINLPRLLQNDGQNTLCNSKFVHIRKNVDAGDVD